MILKAISTEEEKSRLVQILQPYITRVKGPYDGHPDGSYRYHIDICFPGTVTILHKQNGEKPCKHGEKC